MTYGYKTLDDGNIVPYPIDTQLPQKKYTNLSDIPAYCLSHYRDRRIGIADMCARLNMRVVFIDSDTNKYSRQQNVAHDTVDLIYYAISQSKYPFLILEDDATLIDSVPKKIAIPTEADLIYWGSNKFSGPPVLSSALYLSEYNDSYYRIVNSQSSHAILVPSKQSAIFFKNILLESLIYNQFSDVCLPNISKEKLFLTPKDGPYFYQNDGKNGWITNFKWKTTKIPIV